MGGEKLEAFMQVPPPNLIWSHFSLPMILYTGLGSAIFWGKNGRGKLKVFVLSTLFDSLKWPNDNPWRIIVEFVLFITFGILIGIGAIGPATIMQALTAGIAWTGVVAKRVD
ncbi:hypothetical protein [Granulicella sp. L60]|uniref:hypothetical protein n=1 Tax=Granulicella sp. L60 TaxID=1641866 RepID=UPI00131DC1D2|nr:hypothetical protein [Granulicella sp. L60]